MSFSRQLRTHDGIVRRVRGVWFISLPTKMQPMSLYPKHSKSKTHFLGPACFNIKDGEFPVVVTGASVHAPRQRKIIHA